MTDDNVGVQRLSGAHIATHPATGSKTALETYHHDTLTRPASQIRLLQILSVGRADHISISIQTYDRTSAPAYASLSYTWGDNKLSKQVVANGRRLDVTENCWYALGQLRLFNFAEYYWIDQICIDQAHSAEKSAQVNLMGDTYQNADCVVVSLGKHTKESVFLFSQIVANGIDTEGYDTGNEIQIEDWLKSMDEPNLERMLSAFTALGSAAYWTRLWTVQEFALAPQVMIMCGNGCLEWSLLSSLTATLCKLLRINREYYRGRVGTNHTEKALLDLPMSVTGGLRSTVRGSSSGFASFSDVVLKLGTRKCADPRDRIFGLLSLIDWPEGCPPLEADYTLTSTALAFKALEYADAGKEASMACQLLRILEISSDDAHMQNLSIQRALHPPSPAISRFPTNLPPTFPPCTHYFRITGAEDLTSISATWTRLDFERMPKVFKRVINKANPLSAKVSVLVPRLAQPHDIVVQLDSLSGGRGSMFQHHRAAMSGVDETFDKAALVLREGGDGRYAIVGHAVFAAESLALSQLTPLAQEDLEFDLYIDREDLFFWSWRLQSSKIAGGDSSSAPSQLASRFCAQEASSYAVARRNREKATLHDTARAAAYLTQNGADVRQKLAIRSIGG